MGIYEHDTFQYRESNPKRPMLKYHLTSLGCPKNLVESEEMMAQLAMSGMVLVHDPTEADLLIVNTCGFIGPAKEESIDVILELCTLRRNNPNQRLLVVGCLVERYRKELKEELAEVDDFIGVRDHDQFLHAAWKVFNRKPDVEPNQSLPFNPRLLTTPPHLAYLRISDGCFHNCSFCAIPMMRGTLRSRPIEEIVAEAKGLAAGGVKEIVIVSQDTTSYGIDLYRKLALTDLLTKLEEIEGIEWIRIMYLYPHLVDNKLIQYFSRSEKLVSYVDMPIQHGDPEILKLMKRGARDVHIKRSIERLREVRTDMTIRTTVIVGFPGEKQTHYNNLRNLLEEIQFDRIGVFAYSREEGTEAANYPNQVSNRIIDKRYNKLLDWAAEQSMLRNERYVGEILTVIVDQKDPDGDGYWGRFQGQAPDVDGQVQIRANELVAGRFAPIRITHADEDNLYGQLNQDINIVRE
jgi:ribosomal protein S12 methylthiotransferase